VYVCMWGVCMCLWGGLHAYVGVLHMFVGASACVCRGIWHVYVGGLRVYVSMWKVCMYMYMCVCAGSATADARYLASSQEPDEELQSLLSYEEVCQKAIPDLKVNQHSALS